MWLDCPRAVTEQPTCDGSGSLEFTVDGPDYSVGVGPYPECVTKDCTCNLTDDECAVLDQQAVDRYNEGPDEEGN